VSEKRRSDCRKALVVGLMAISILCLNSVVSAENSDAYFVFGSQANNETFVIKLTDPVRIKEARSIIRGMQADRTHVSGRVVKEPADYNRPWSFHLAPDSISFFQNNNETCNAGIRDVEDRLQEAGGNFLPGNKWCPWDSKVIKEMKIEADEK